MSFYSSCLLEAIKAKLANWSNVKIHYGYEKSAAPCFGLHFWWSENGYKYHFMANDEVGWHNYLWHEGRILRKIDMK